MLAYTCWKMKVDCLHPLNTFMKLCQLDLYFLVPCDFLDQDPILAIPCFGG